LRVLFHIDAELRVNPAPAVAFETVLELTTGHASIRERTA
jgi:predicted component of type VI protein secretion system